MLAGSTPVIAFGNPQSSTVATLGLNPSRIEFEERGVELDGRYRRFETLRSLGVSTLEDADDELVERVVERCNTYFHGNPYRWFDRLEEMLNAVDASYFDDTACHLDLSQWATDPTWNGLPRSVQQRLVTNDAQFLRAQLEAEHVRLLLLNGRAVINAFQRELRGQLQQEPEDVTDRTVASKLYTGRLDGVRVIGWSTNLQSSFGVTTVLRAKLAERVRELRDQAS